MSDLPWYTCKMKLPNAYAMPNVQALQKMGLVGRSALYKQMVSMGNQANSSKAMAILVTSGPVV